VWVRIPPPAPCFIDRIGVGRYGDLSSLIRSSSQVRLLVTPLANRPRGARSLGEHLLDRQDQVGSIPTLRTLHHVTVAEWHT
jgi:hypothetical protein